MRLALLLFALVPLASLADAEESALRDAPSLAQPAEPADATPAPLTAPVDIRSSGAAAAAEPEQPKDAPAQASKPVRPVANVPMPPTKPAFLLAAEAPKDTAEEEPEAQPENAEAIALASAPAAPTLQSVPSSSRLFASLPPPVAAPTVTSPAPLAAAPPEALPLPPSMRDGQPPEAESDGEEEASLPGGFEKQVDTVELACVKPEVMEIVKRAGQFFRAVPIVTSGFRARGRRGSLHRRCMAVDFVVPGVSTQTLASYLRSQPDAGGVGTYCNTRSVHIDVGEKRNWGYCGFHRTYFSLR